MNEPPAACIRDQTACEQRVGDICTFDASDNTCKDTPFKMKWKLNFDNFRSFSNTTENGIGTEDEFVRTDIPSKDYCLVKMMNWKYSFRQNKRSAANNRRSVVL